MDKELQKYYESRFSMMATDGWKDLVEDAQKFFDSLNQVMPITTESELQLKRGQLDILQWILSLKAVTEQTYEQLMSGDSSGD